MTVLGIFDLLLISFIFSLLQREEIGIILHCHILIEMEFYHYFVL
ncbi:unnamed protein product [Schistosoma curassoni]|uniref:Uncharacterized protein n=1 Tax=Schistosoma curassoni TaxID=6186 RepID=A0A183KUG7_9TREM|nr:unnamed protein product [Schistosoma curassoni]